GLWRRHEAAVAGGDEGHGGEDAGRRRIGRIAQSAEGSSRGPAPGSAEFAGTDGSQRQADAAGFGRISGQEEMTSFVIASAAKQSILRQEPSWIASLRSQ